MKKVLFILLTITSFMSCKDLFTDDELTFIKTPNESSSLRMDGYYYFNLKPDGVVVIVYYQNGVVYLPGQGANLEYFENKFKSHNNAGSIKANWGLYIIKSDTLFTNALGSFSGMGVYHYTNYFSKDLIMNDTTILSLETKFYDGTIHYYNDTLHFKQFSPKPDSTNVFIQ